jgi:gamma-glutamylputrescine oxidase
MPINNQPLSYWERASFLENIDLAIIGSGIVGLSAALRAKELCPWLNVAVLERGIFPSGASTRNAGFACFGSISELLADLSNASENEVFALVEKRWRGLHLLRERIGDADLGYWECGGYELFGDGDKESYLKCKEALPYFNERVGRITKRANTYISEDGKIKDFGFKNIRHLIRNQAEGQIHTGNMMRKLLFLAQSKNILILNNINIQKIEPHASEVLLEASLGVTLRVPKVLVATNGFAAQLLHDLPVKPARNQVLITKPINGLSLRGTFHYDEGYYYFRNVGDRLLLGGGRNVDTSTETTSEFGTTSIIQNRLLDMLSNMLLPGQHFEVEQWWSGIMGVGPVKRPILQKLSPHLCVAVRLGGMGVALGSGLGHEAAEMLLGHSEPSGA